MALIKLTAVVDNISGKLNGTVFARNKGGHYMRSKSNPTNPRTASQSLVRGVLATISSDWRKLTESQRNAWSAAAENFPYQNRLGDTKILSGFNLHQKLNQNLYLLSSAPDSAIPLVVLENPPTPRDTPAPINFRADINLTEDSEEIHLRADFFENTDRMVVMIYATDSMSPGISNFKNRLRLVGVENVAADSLDANIYSRYRTRFDSPQPEAKIGFAVRTVNPATGQASPMILLDKLVPTPAP